jgi:hypothetical protein
MSSLVQVERGTSFTPIVEFQYNGVGTNLDSGLPVITLTKPDGTAGPASGTVTSLGGGQYSFVAPAQPECIWLTYTAVGTIGGQVQTRRGTIEWLGEALFNVSAFRAMKVAGGTPFALTAIPLYSDRQIMDTRTEILDEFEEILGFSPVPRFRRETFDGDGRTCLILPGLLASRVLSVTVNGVAQTAGNYQIGVGNTLEAVTSYSYGTPFTAGRRNVTVEWVHGWERVKGIGSHIAMIWAGAQLNPSGFSSASTISMPDGSTYTYEPSETGRGGFRRPSGIRQADRWFDLHSQASVGVA